MEELYVIVMVTESGSFKESLTDKIYEIRLA